MINFFTFSIFFGYLYKKLHINSQKKIFFFYGWLFGFGYFLTNLYWITISLTFDNSFSFLIPFALFLIPSFLAIFYGLISFTFFLLKPKNILSAFFLFSVLFGIFEFIRGTILTGFPWNLIVYSFSDNLDFISILSLVGTYSLNLISVTLFTVPAIYILRESKKEIGICIILLLLPIIFFVYGNFQKKQFLAKEIKEIPYTIRIVASNISLDRFYDNSSPEKVINELISISSPIKERKFFFIWPEGIIPNVYQNEMYLYDNIFIKNFDENHLIGLGITNRKLEKGNYEFFNSFSIFDNRLNLIETYNKNNLVPFGEFLPLESFFKKFGFKTITNNFGSFTKSNDRKIIEIKNDYMKKIKFLPLICYEIIYSGNLTNNYDFDFILNISEDGWFGNSIGPKQHFVHSIFRAIETGKYVIRSSNNGMSAIINPLGEIEKKINFGYSSYIDFERRRDFNSTFFSTYGNMIFIILILVYIFLAISFNKIRND